LRNLFLFVKKLTSPSTGAYTSFVSSRAHMCLCPTGRHSKARVSGRTQKTPASAGTCCPCTGRGTSADGRQSRELSYGTVTVQSSTASSLKNPSPVPYQTVTSIFESETASRLEASHPPEESEGIHSTRLIRN